MDMSKGSVSFIILLFLGLICLVQQAQVQSLSSKPLSPANVEQLQAQAQGGDPAAQVNLGKAYEDGNGAPQSDKQALRWYGAAAEHGNTPAQNNVGNEFLAVIEPNRSREDLLPVRNFLDCH